MLRLPGIGSYTASAVRAIAFNEPAVVIETNIRTVFIFFFLPKSERVTDGEITPLIDATMDRANPREWYYALFDYGAMLKKRVKLNEKSAHYYKQSVFEGSNREMRSNILRTLLGKSPLSMEELIVELKSGPARVRKNVEQLQREGFLILDEDTISIA